MRSAPFPCTGCPEAKHVLDRLGGEGFSLSEGADARVDGGKEGAQGLEPALDEGPLGAPRPALLAHRPRRLGGGGQHLSQVPPEAALHDLLHHAPEVGGRLAMRPWSWFRMPEVAAAAPRPSTKVAIDRSIRCV